MIPGTVSKQLKEIGLEVAKQRLKPNNWDLQDNVTVGLGLALAELCIATGIDPILIAASALEDINHHKDAATLREMAMRG